MLAAKCCLKTIFNFNEKIIITFPIRPPVHSSTLCFLLRRRRHSNCFPFRPGYLTRERIHTIGPQFFFSQAKYRKEQSCHSGKTCTFLSVRLWLSRIVVHNRISRNCLRVLKFSFLKSEVTLTIVIVATHIALAAVSSRVPRAQLPTAVGWLVTCSQDETHQIGVFNQ